MKLAIFFFFALFSMVLSALPRIDSVDRSSEALAVGGSKNGVAGYGSGDYSEVDAISDFTTYGDAYTSPHEAFSKGNAKQHGKVKAGGAGADGGEAAVITGGGTDSGSAAATKHSGAISGASTESIGGSIASGGDYYGGAAVGSTVKGNSETEAESNKKSSAKSKADSSSLNIAFGGGLDGGFVGTVGGVGAKTGAGAESHHGAAGTVTDSQALGAAAAETDGSNSIVVGGAGGSAISESLADGSGVSNGESSAAGVAAGQVYNDNGVSEAAVAAGGSAGGESSAASR